jgi:hypothetical protein
MNPKALIANAKNNQKESPNERTNQFVFRSMAWSRCVMFYEICLSFCCVGVKMMIARGTREEEEEERKRRFDEL